MNDYPAKTAEQYKYLFKPEDYIEHLEKNKRTTDKKIIQDQILFTETFKIPSKVPVRSIALIYKGGDTENPSNFRPIIVTPGGTARESEIAKLYSMPMQINRRMQFAGFIQHARKRVYEYIQLINETDSGSLIFVDIKNAFGSVYLPLMTEMINCPNLRAYFVKNYINAPVRIGRTNFTWNYGLMQGSPLSPMLFLIYLNYVLEEAKNFATDIIAFMDDIVFYFKEEEHFTEISQIFASYCLEFNATKMGGINSIMCLEPLTRHHLGVPMLNVYNWVSQFMEIITLPTDAEEKLIYIIFEKMKFLVPAIIKRFNKNKQSFYTEINTPRSLIYAIREFSQHLN